MTTDKSSPQFEVSIIVSEALKTSAFNISKEPEEISVLLEKPKESSFGDIAFPCHLLSKELRKSPVAIATDLSSAVAKLVKGTGALSKVEARGPYVNFFLNNSFVASYLIPSILNGEFLSSRESSGERVMVEYSQPNTHKAFHVGHVRCASLGDTLSRILSWLGNEVIPVNYIGDEGTHVAKCLWYYLKFRSREIPASNKGEFLGVMYSDATNLLDLSAYTDAPFPGVRAAKVLSVDQHPQKKEWKVVHIDTDTGEQTVVTGAKGIEKDSLVPYIASGNRFNGKLIGTVEKLGVTSSGMILSEREMGLSDNNDVVRSLPVGTKIGDEVAEVYRTDDLSVRHRPILSIIQEREGEVSAVLQKMEHGDPEIKSLWDRTREWSLDEFKEIYRWLDCRFDHFFYESEFGESGKALAREFFNRGVFVESDGAIGADLSRWNLGFCILIKRDGTALYATRDLSLAQKKFDQYQISRSIYVVDSAQTLHFQQVFKCLELMGYRQAERCYHLAYAQVVRPEGKMSSRKGNVILFSELKARLIEKATTEFLEKYRGQWSDQEITNAASVIALATIRYGMLKIDNNSLVVFDLDEWTSQTGNTGPYILYAYTRISSILRETGSRKDRTIKWELLSHESEVALIKMLLSYHEVIRRAGSEYSPHLICSYVFELSKEFSRMYRFCPVAKAADEYLKNARATLIESCGEVIKHALSLLGIPVLQRM